MSLSSSSIGFLLDLSHLPGLILSLGHSSLLSSSFIHHHLLHNPLIVLGNDWHLYLIVCHQISLIILLAVIVILNRTRQDGEFGNGFSSIVPSHGGDS